MKSRLAENIRSYRKDNGMTQESLAERLGITLGTISKWERGSSEPDVDYLMKLAEIFRISIDALLGFSLRGNDEDSTIEKIDACVRERDIEGALRECDAALLRFPNRFRIVYQAGRVYNLEGFVSGDKPTLRKAVDLFQHALELISQNTNPDINEFSIRNRIAECHIRMEEYSTGVEELKQNNICGVNNADIGMQLISSLKRNEEGKTYIGQALVHNISELVTIASAMTSYHLNKKNYWYCRVSCLWFIRYFEMLKIMPEEPSFVDKYIAFFRLTLAYATEADGFPEEAEVLMRQAIDEAKRFDANPVFGFSNIAFLDQDVQLNVFDDVGTAVESLDLVLKDVGEAGGGSFCRRAKEVMENDEIGENVGHEHVAVPKIS